MMNLAHKKVGLYPIWLCPVRHIKKGNDSKWGPNDLLVDLGIYGFTKVPDFDREKVHSALEASCIEGDGFVGLYADTNLSRDQFDTMFKTYSGGYEEARRKYGCEGAFPHVYEKISKIGRTNFIK